MKIIVGNTADSFGKYTPSALIRDSRLSFEARAVAMFLMSMATRWELRATSLPFILKCPSSKGHLGRDATRKILKELEVCGYLSRAKYRSKEGRWVWDSTLSPFAGLPIPTSSDNAIATSSPAVDGCAKDGGSVDQSSCTNLEQLNKTPLPTQIENPALDVSNQNVSGGIENLDLTHPLLVHSKAIINQVWRRFENQISVEQMQQVVDEFTGVLSASRCGNHPPIKSSRGWLIAVTKSMLDGDFAPEFSVAIQRNRSNHHAVEIDSSTEKFQSEDPIDDATREKNRLACQNMLSTLSKGKAS